MSEYYFPRQMPSIELGFVGDGVGADGTKTMMIEGRLGEELQNHSEYYGSDELVSHDTFWHSRVQSGALPGEIPKNKNRSLYLVYLTCSALGY